MQLLFFSTPWKQKTSCFQGVAKETSSSMKWVNPLSANPTKSSNTQTIRQQKFFSLYGSFFSLPWEQDHFGIKRKPDVVEKLIPWGIRKSRLICMKVSFKGVTALLRRVTVTCMLTFHRNTYVTFEIPALTIKFTLQ